MSAARGLVLVTAGPSYEPIDEVRRLTNSSSGELGVMLANRLAKAGWPVTCLLGTGAVVRGPLHAGLHRSAFSTNDDLLRRFEEYARGEPVAAVFQAAALCDFRVAQIAGAAMGEAKISSRQGELVLTLEPALKVISRLRGLFPAARLVGWKYELSGTREEVIEKGRRQLLENGTDLCLLNGRAYGAGFGALAAEGPITALPDKATLCDWLAGWLAEQIPA